MNEQESDPTQTVPEGWPESQAPESWSQHRPIPRRPRKRVNLWIWRGIGIFCGLVAAFAFAQIIAQRFNRAQWHYTAVEYSPPDPNLSISMQTFADEADASRLNSIGRDGGELVGIIPVPKKFGGPTYRLIFKHRGTGYVMSEEEFQRSSHQALVDSQKDRK